MAVAVIFKTYPLRKLEEVDHHAVFCSFFRPEMTCSMDVLRTGDDTASRSFLLNTFSIRDQWIVGFANDDLRPPTRPKPISRLRRLQR
jgi:hypothetical protein